MDRYKIMKIISQFLFAVIVIVCVFLLLLNFNVISFNSSDLPLVITLNQNEVGIKLGDTYQLEATVLPADVYYGSIAWSSSDDSIATVNSSTGFIETHKPGDVTISASVPFNNLKAECVVHVLVDDVLIENIKISNDRINLAIGKSYIIKYTVSPINATTHNFNFISSDTSVAVVNEKGVIKAIGEGTAVITMKSKLNNVQDTVVVSVYRYSDSYNNSVVSNSSQNNGTYADTSTYYKSKSVSLSQSSLEMIIGSQTKLSATVSPSNASQSITWSSANEGIATVNSSGAVTAQRAGTTSIIATSIDGVSAICKITVKEASSTTIIETPTVGIDIEERVLKLEVGLTKTLNINFYLVDSSKQGVVWSSSNDDIAIVSNGTISAKAVGTCIIKATSADGKYSDYLTVTVTPSTSVIELNSIRFSQTSYTAGVNDTITLVPTIEPSNATYRFLTWTTSNRNVATVENGVVYCVNTGNVTITASSGNISASVTVNISSISPSSISLENTNNYVVNLTVGQSLYLIKKIYPSNATNTAVTWRSSDSNVVTVDANGMIRGVSAGTAAVTVTTVNGKMATTKVIVS